MNKIRITVIATITFFVLGFSTIYLGRGFFNYKGELTKLNKQYLALSKDYTDLLKAKQEVIIKWDTIIDSIFVNNPIPVDTEDSITPTDTLHINYYTGTKSDTSVDINYSAKTLGTLLNIGFTYKVKQKNTIITNTVYVDKFVDKIIEIEKPHLLLYGNIGYPSTLYSFDAVLVRPTTFQYKAGYINVDKTSYFTVGIGVKIF